MSDEIHEDSGEDSVVPVRVKGVYIAETLGGAPSPVVLLEDERLRVVPIFVGLSEAISIHNALSGEVSPRPMTHDLFISVLECLEATISDVLIDDLEGGIYYARLSLVHGSKRSELDARPSDCLALAIRAKAPIHIQERIIEISGMDRSEMEGLRRLDSYMH